MAQKTSAPNPEKHLAATERPPVVVVMGHVDHGKSTLLDFIRKSNTVDKEFGGITQHVAAYEVERVSKETGASKKITFIDTPGHAAFSAIRARGANVADIAILVVAADDGVKAQTLEALSQIREAKIPFLVAINKVDKPNADLNRTISTLLEQGVYLEQYGGDVPWAAISAKVGTGVEELLDLILLLAEIQEFKGTAETEAVGFVIEAHRDQKRGIAATLIITNGTLASGQFVSAGRAVAPVRIMEDFAGKAIKSATFSSPVTLVGFDELPEVGATFAAFMSKLEAQEQRATFAESARTVAAETGDGFALPVILRADVTGSLEALEQEVSKITDGDAYVRIVQSGIGSISENDVKSALASDPPALLIGFNVPIDPVGDATARERGVTFESFNIIYKLTERLQELLAKRRPKREVETVLGRAKVLKVFSSGKGEALVGGSVIEGALSKNGKLRVMRRKEAAGNAVLISIQANKQAVQKIEADREFGAQVETTDQILEGDILEEVKTSME